MWRTRWRRFLASAAFLSFTLATSILPVKAQTVIDFDSLGNGVQPGNILQASGVLFQTGNISNSVLVGGTVSFASFSNSLEILTDPNAISEPNFAAPVLTDIGQRGDLLIEFGQPISDLMMTTDEAIEGPDIVRLLALTPSATLNEYIVLDLAEGLDNATTAPANLLRVNPGVSFRYAIFQVTVEGEGFDDLVFTLAQSSAPEPTGFALLLLGASVGWLLQGAGRRLPRLVLMLAHRGQLVPPIGGQQADANRVDMSIEPSG